MKSAIKWFTLCEYIWNKKRENQKKNSYAIELYFLDADPGGRLNKKDGLTRYGDSHVKDKTS